MSEKSLQEDFKQARFFAPTELVKTIQAFLQQTDEHALESVRQDIGGPFGARFLIVAQDGSIYPVGKNVGNAVVSSGIASRHAEHENWTQNWDALTGKLRELQGQKKMLIELSSGESCINCHAKQEIGFQTLFEQGYLYEGQDRAGVVYGATYRQTADVAGFNDLVYLLAVQDIKDIDMDAGPDNKIHEQDIKKAKALASGFKHDISGLAEIPEDVADFFEQSEEPVAVLMRDGEIFSVGYDERDKHFTRTPEVVALQKACERQKSLKKDLPWDLGGNQHGVKLYTSTREVGPLMLAEGYWSNALDFVTVQHDRQAEWETKEHPELSNDQFLTHIAKHTHERSGSKLKAYYMPTENKAQHFWANKDDAVNYDGAKAEPEL